MQQYSEHDLIHLSSKQHLWNCITFEISKVLKFIENDDSFEVKKILLQKYYNIFNNVTLKYIKHTNLLRYW